MQWVVFFAFVFAVLGGIALAVYVASRGSATSMSELGDLFVLLAIPLGLLVVALGVIWSLVRRIRGTRPGSGRPGSTV